ncbi:MAG TPA: hypothetical protein VFF52_27900 [Isosphaeraceae bacterium]|nr:hypothetical protein [Isosphaeraceae bacterium]
MHPRQAGRLTSGRVAVRLGAVAKEFQAAQGSGWMLGTFQRERPHAKSPARATARREAGRTPELGGAPRDFAQERPSPRNPAY